MRFPTAVLALAIAFGAAPVTGLAQSCDFSVAATIVDATSGKFISSVQPAMVHAKVRKSFIAASDVERIKRFRVLLLLDASGSMSATGPGSTSNERGTVQKLTEMLEENLYSFPSGAQVSFGIFNEQVVFANEFTSNAERLHHLIPETIARLRSPGRGQTSLFDAVHMALAQFGSVQPGDTILLLTDGGENGSRQVSEKSLVHELSQKGIRLFVVLVQNASPAQAEEITALPTMSELAARSGGAVRTYPTTSYLSWSNKKYLQSAREELKRFWNDEVLSAYLLRFSIPYGIRNEEKWVLTIDPAANEGKQMAAGYPHRLGPCPLTTAAR